MSTVVSRTLAGSDVLDRLAIKVNGASYVGKSGVFKVHVTSYSFLCGADDGNLMIDIRPPQYCPVCDTIMVENTTKDQGDGVGSPSTVTLNADYYITLNNGVPGPAAFVQGDGTWDLLKIDFQAAVGTTSAVLTVTYTVTFKDYADFTGSPTSDTVVVGVQYNKFYDSKKISAIFDDYDSGVACVAIKVVSLANVTSNGNPGAGILNIGNYPLDFANDSVPEFAVSNIVHPYTYGQRRDVVKHAISKTTGTITYLESLSDYVTHSNVMIFAFNGGLVDGNARLTKSAAGNDFDFMVAEMAIRQDWPTTDTVVGTCTYTKLSQNVP